MKKVPLQVHVKAEFIRQRSSLSCRKDVTAPDHLMVPEQLQTKHGGGRTKRTMETHTQTHDEAGKRQR